MCQCVKVIQTITTTLHNYIHFLFSNVFTWATEWQELRCHWSTSLKWDKVHVLHARETAVDDTTAMLLHKVGQHGHIRVHLFIHTPEPQDHDILERGKRGKRERGGGEGEKGEERGGRGERRERGDREEREERGGREERRDEGHRERVREGERRKGRGRGRGERRGRWKRSKREIIVVYESLEHTLVVELLSLSM